MIKIITITDPMQVRIGDKAYFKDCDFGFTVTRVDANDKYSPFSVYSPLSGDYYWILLSRFDHATRDVAEPEWPDPGDIKLHDYLGADGRRYIYNPVDKDDSMPWLIEGYSARHAREEIGAHHRDALPLTELKLVPVKDDDEQ